jgi:hypothetical protein
VCVTIAWSCPRFSNRGQGARRTCYASHRSGGIGARSQSQVTLRLANSARVRQVTPLPRRASASKTDPLREAERLRCWRARRASRYQQTLSSRYL